MARASVLKEGGKTIIFCDYSKLTNNNDVMSVMREARQLIRAETPGTVRVLNDINGIRFDTATKDIFVRFAVENRTVVRKAAVIGVTNLTSVMLAAVVKLSGRKNIRPFSGRHEAMTWLISDA